MSSCLEVFWLARYFFICGGGLGAYLNLSRKLSMKLAIIHLRNTFFDVSLTLLSPSNPGRCVGGGSSSKWLVHKTVIIFINAVVEDNPSASYDTITRLVQEKWSALSDTNKQHFCMLGKEEIENLKKTVVEKKKLIQKIKPKPAAQV